MAQFCVHCGAELHEEGAFCHSCGNRKSATVGASTNAAAVADNASQICRDMPIEDEENVKLLNPYAGKKAQIIGRILAGGGALIMVLWAFSAIRTTEAATGTLSLLLGIVMFFVGAIVVAVGKFQHWYHWE